MSGLYMSVVVITVMWLVSVVVLKLLTLNMPVVVMKVVSTTVGAFVTKTVRPERDGTLFNSSDIKVFSSDREMLSRAVLLAKACASASVEPMDAGKTMA